MPLEEAAVVATAEEAGLLALRPPRDVQPGRRRLRADLVLRRVTERERDTVEQRGVDGREHVRLVLARIRASATSRSPSRSAIRA